jgi:hypothetical protein
MKQYKLAAWPELPATYHRTVYRRMLSDMSHRYMSLSALVMSSGATGVLVECESDSDSFYDTTLRPVGDWLRTVFGADQKI